MKIFGIDKLIKKIKIWKDKNPGEFWFLLIILSLAALLRFYKISEYMTFLGDEGRDVLIVRRIFTELHPPLIGPGTSIGGMYLGPLYYYMMAPALLLAGFSPVGPAVMVALLGIVTVFLVWFVAREWFGSTAAKISGFLYAISPTVIIFSRSSWNPNIMPFFALISVYSIWRFWKYNEYKWLLVLGVSFAFVLQSHYLGLLLAPTIFVYWFLAYIRNKKVGEDRKVFKYSIAAYLIFLLLMSPLFIFDLRHDFMNTKAMYQFFTVRQTTVSAKPWSAIPKIPEIFQTINLSLIGSKNILITKLLSLVMALGVMIVAVKKPKNYEPYILLGLWFLFGLIGFGVYKQSIYDHYFGFVFVVPFLILGGLFSKMLAKGVLAKILALVLIGVVIYVNLVQNPLRYSPNNQLKRSMNVSQKIIDLAGGKEFDLAVLAERNYEDGYRYFLELNDAKVLHADRWDPSTIADQLFVICEMEEKKCDPTHSPKAEVANFGMSKIDEKWEVDGVIIYRLLHSK